MLVMLVSSVSAFAISNPYWQTNPLKISPGESTKATLVLNNGGGATEAVDVSCVISEGLDVARISDSGSYPVPADGQANVNVDISIPDSAAIGSSRTVKLSCKPVAPENAGSPVALSQAIDQTLYMDIVEKQLSAVEPAPAGGRSWALYLIVGVLLLMVIIFLLSRRKK